MTGSLCSADVTPVWSGPVGPVPVGPVGPVGQVPVGPAGPVPVGPVLVVWPVWFRCFHGSLTRLLLVSILNNFQFADMFEVARRCFEGCVCGS